MMTRQWKFQTACLHAGDRHNRSGHVSPPICRSTAFEFPDVVEGARRAADIEAPDFYGRWGSANARELEAQIAALEGTDDAVCTSSGMAAIGMAAQAFLKPGGHFVGVRACYSESRILLDSLTRCMGVETAFVDARSPEAVRKAMRPDTSLVYIETPANPTLSLVDIAAVAEATHSAADAVLVVDSTFGTPYNQQPLALGADLVIHSATKYLGGHSDVIAGVCAGRAALVRRVREAFSFHGPVLDPQAAWLLSRGLRTLGLRMERHNHNALEMARFLAKHPMVEQVHYPMLDSYPQQELARRQMRGGGGMVCFEVRGGMEAALAVLERVELVKLAVSLGGVVSTIAHPASMTHNLIPREQRELAGIRDGMLRFSVGIEDLDDLLFDISSALG
jgi:methionine-gamma-lyase